MRAVEDELRAEYLVAGVGSDLLALQPEVLVQNTGAFIILQLVGDGIFHAESKIPTRRNPRRVSPLITFKQGIKQRK